jgi:hypothetical protein
MHVPKGIQVWLLVSGLTVLWDAAFVLLQPRTFPGGDLHWLFKVYDTYAQVDKSYSKEAFLDGEAFPRAQALVNLVEVALQFYCLILLWISKDKPKGVLVGFSCQLMTLAKTVLYFTVDGVSGFKNSKHNPIFNLVFLYVLPNSLWIIFPAIAVLTLGAQLLSAAQKSFVSKNKKN